MLSNWNLVVHHTMTCFDILIKLLYLIEQIAMSNNFDSTGLLWNVQSYTLNEIFMLLNFSVQQLLQDQLLTSCKKHKNLTK